MAIDTTSADYRQGLIDEVPPFGMPDSGPAMGFSDSATEPQDNGSDEPQQDDDEYHESGSEVNGLREAINASRRRLRLAAFGSTDAQVRRCYQESRHGWKAEWEAVLWFDMKCYIGTDEDLPKAEAKALAAAAAHIAYLIRKANEAGDLEPLLVASIAQVKAGAL